MGSAALLEPECWQDGLVFLEAYGLRSVRKTVQDIIKGKKQSFWRSSWIADQHGLEACKYFFNFVAEETVQHD